MSVKLYIHTHPVTPGPTCKMHWPTRRTRIFTLEYIDDRKLGQKLSGSALDSSHKEILGEPIEISDLRPAAAASHSIDRYNYGCGGSCCGVAGESGAMVKCTPLPCPDCRMNATSVAARAAASWTDTIGN
jgi:hypothetical protein